MHAVVNAAFFVEENLWLQRKRYVFGKSALDISSLIIRATKVDLSVYVGCVAICRTNCYKRLVRCKNADFDGDVPLRIKIGERSWQLAGGEKVS